MSSVLNKNQSSVLEYPTYDEAENCLEPKEAVERYRAERASHPGALVTIEELHCGEHWKIKVYQSRAEKEQYYRTRIQRIWERFHQRIMGDLQEYKNSR